MIVKALGSGAAEIGGHSTCYTFALKLALGQVKLEDCPVLQEPECAGQRAQLLDLLPEGMLAVGRKESY